MSAAQLNIHNKVDILANFIPHVYLLRTFSLARLQYQLNPHHILHHGLSRCTISLACRLQFHSKHCK
jgi:hypothetical protein